MIFTLKNLNFIYTYTYIKSAFYKSLDDLNL